MAGNDNMEKKGFSGLSSLTSEISGLDEPTKPESKAAANPSARKRQPQPQLATATPEPERKTTNAPPPSEADNSGKSGDSSSVKWILGILGAIFVIWMISKSNEKPSYNPPPSSQNSRVPQSSPGSVVTTPSTTPSAPKNAGLQYTKPSIGTNNVLSVPEIQWCIREGIRIETLRDVINAQVFGRTNAAIDEFNRIVNDYNSHCGSYRYRQGAELQAERNVEPYRSQIVAEAIREGRQLGRPYQPSPPPVSPRLSTSSASEKPTTSRVPEKPSAQYVREAQQLLTDLGYKPGPVDGDYGSRTADAVKAFQRDAGITQDGQIGEGLLNILRRAKTEYRPPDSTP